MVRRVGRVTRKEGGIEKCVVVGIKLQASFSFQLRNVSQSQTGARRAWQGFVITCWLRHRTKFHNFSSALHMTPALR